MFRSRTSGSGRIFFRSSRHHSPTTSTRELSLSPEDTEKRLVHFRDPGRQIYRPILDVDSKNFYVPLGDRQSDIWTMELRKQ